MPREIQFVGALNEGVFLIEGEHADLLTRTVDVEDNEPFELSDQCAVVEIAKLGIFLNLAAEIRADYATETKMTEATKAGNMTPSEMRGLVQGAVIVGNIATSVVVIAVALFLWWLLKPAPL